MGRDLDVRTRLRAELADCGVQLPEDWTDDAPLISSGTLDSLGLFRLALWVEKEVGCPVDPGAVDIATEWDSIASVVAFVEASRQGEA